MNDSILNDPRVQRLIKIQDAVRVACPGEDGEIVDADAVYLNFEAYTAVVISEFTDQNGPQVELLVVEWDRTGGVHNEFLLGHVRPEYAPVIVKAFLDEQYRRWQEMDDDFSSAFGIE